MGRLPFSLVESLQEGLAREHYLADRGLSTAIMGTYPTPQEVAEVVAFLLSERSSHLTSARLKI